MATLRGGTRTGTATPVTAANFSTQLTNLGSDAASTIPISSANFTATTLKGVLDELFTKCQ